jgi:hypothetical protein
MPQHKHTTPLKVAGEVTVGDFPSFETVVRDRAFKKRRDVLSVTFPDTITTIGCSAFRDCTRLAGKLVLPQSLKEIKERAFQGCMNFTGELVLPELLMRIGPFAFSGCTGLTGDVFVMDSTQIHDSSFLGTAVRVVRLSRAALQAEAAAEAARSSQSAVAGIFVAQVDLRALRRQSGIIDATSHNARWPEPTEMKLLRELATDTTKQSRASERVVRLRRFAVSNSDGAIASSAATAAHGAAPVVSSGGIMHRQYTAVTATVSELATLQSELRAKAEAAAASPLAGESPDAVMCAQAEGGDLDATPDETQLPPDVCEGSRKISCTTCQF